MKDPAEAVALLVKAAFSRPATDEELEALTEYVRRGATGRPRRTGRWSGRW